MGQPCTVCGETNITDVHETTEKHLRVLATSAVNVADTFRICPFCKGRRELESCRDAEHKKTLVYYRELLSDR